MTTPAKDTKALDAEFTTKVKELPVEVRFKAVALNSIFQEKKKLDEELEKEIKALQAKYEKLFLPLYGKSNEIIDGSRLPTDAELHDLEKYFTADELAKKAESIKQEAIPEFWLKALTNSPILSEEIRDNDREVLKSCRRIECVRDENTQNFTLTFQFGPNEYFENTTLTKKITFSADGEPEKTEGTEIKWKEGKNITVKTVKKKQKNKKTGQHRVTTKEVPAESFFNFFGNSGLPKEDAEDEEEAASAEERFQIDMDIAQILADEIIPYSLDYYIGLVDEDGEDYGDDDEDLDDIDEEDDDDEPRGKGGKGGKGGKKGGDDDDDEDEEAGLKPKKNKGKKGGAGGGKGAEGQKPECKNQ